MEEVRQHRTEDDAWMVLHGKVRAAASPFLCMRWRVSLRQWIARLKGSEMHRQAVLSQEVLARLHRFAAGISG